MAKRNNTAAVHASYFEIMKRVSDPGATMFVLLTISRFVVDTETRVLQPSTIEDSEFTNWPGMHMRRVRRALAELENLRVIPKYSGHGKRVYMFNQDAMKEIREEAEAVG
jgi:hypothetical protein